MILLGDPTALMCHLDRRAVAQRQSEYPLAIGEAINGH
jgi:hypothetical protein